MTVSNRLAGLKSRPKSASVEDVRRVDEVGEARGFLDLSLIHISEPTRPY